MRNRPGIANLVYTDQNTEKMTETDQEKAEVLATYFHSVFTREPDTVIPKLKNKTFQEPLSNIIIKPDEVEKVLAKLKGDKTPGPDNIHPRLLKEIRNRSAQHFHKSSIHH